MQPSSWVQMERLGLKQFVYLLSRKRDKARMEMNQIFCEIIKKRRERVVSEHEDDILDYLLHATYK